MTYAKLRQDGSVEYPPKIYKDETRWIANLPDSPRMLKELGYLELIADQMPEVPEGKQAVPHYNRIDPVGTVVTRTGTDEMTGEEYSYEETVYNIPESYIKVSYTIEDIPTEEGDEDT